MTEIVGVRFKRAAKIYFFDPAGIEFKVNEPVVVETARGMEVGWMVSGPKQMAEDELTEPLKPVIRKANEIDLKKVQEHACCQSEALAKCREHIARHQLPMKLLSCEQNLDGTRLTFYFSAEKRIDFRELVKELTGVFHIRVELRQVGPRDETKLLGGMGRCGRTLCCATYLAEFDPISIKMAKDQDLPLNPMKISGLCGRLLCCLGYENQQYREMKEKLPAPGQKVSTPNGEAVVVWSNPLKDSVLVELESKAMVEVPAAQVVPIGAEPPRSRRRPRRNGNEAGNSSSPDAP